MDAPCPARFVAEGGKITPKQGRGKRQIAAFWTVCWNSSRPTG
jgi:hypothetical protein